MTTHPIEVAKTFTGSSLTPMTFIDPVNDLITHPEVNVNSWFFVGRLEGDGHQFGFLTHQIILPGREKGLPSFSVANSIIDLTTDWYQSEEIVYSQEAVTFPTTGLDVHTPTATVTGPFEEWLVHFTVPGGGEATLTMRPVGGVLYNAGSGSFPFFGMNVFHYAFPSMETTGTVVANDGQTYHVSGVTWLDRQWQLLPPPQNISETKWRWTWFNLSLDNGEYVSIWDIVQTEKEQSFATVLHPDGSQTIAPVTPLILDATNFWVSPRSGKRYPTRWIVRIPSLDAELEVSVARPDQEVPLLGFERYEGTCLVKGTYHGRPTSGYTYVEMTGYWK